MFLLVNDNSDNNNSNNKNSKNKSNSKSSPTIGLNGILINMGESLSGLLDNGMNPTVAFSEGASSGRCPVGEQCRPCRHPATATMMWSKDVKNVVMECYLKSKPLNENGVPIRGCRQRMVRVWQEIGLFEATEQRPCDQLREIRKNGWLSEQDIDVIKKKISQEDAGDINVQAQTLGDATTDENVEDEEIQQEEGVFDTQDEYGGDANIDELNDISEEDRSYVARELGLKQTTQKQSKMPWWQRRIEGDIKRIRKDINILERVKRGQLKKSGKMEQLEKKYNIKRKGVTTVMAEYPLF